MSDQNTKRETKKTPLKSDGSPSGWQNTSNRLPELPNEVRVMGIPFRVEVTEVEEEVLGDTVGLYRRIRISQDVDKKKAWSVFVHEWVHAVLHVNGVTSVIPEEVEEIIAQSVEHAMEEFLLQVGPQLLLAWRDD